MTDMEIIKHLEEIYGDSITHLAKMLRITNHQTISNWKHRGIPARWRPTIWALLKQRCPEVAAKLNRDAFLGVRLPLPSSEDAA